MRKQLFLKFSANMECGGTRMTTKNYNLPIFLHKSLVDLIQEF